jgi:hypothetical protein
MMKPDDSQIEKSLFERSAELLEEMGVDCHWELTRFRAKLSSRTDPRATVLRLEPARSDRVVSSRV